MSEESDVNIFEPITVIKEEIVTSDEEKEEPLEESKDSEKQEEEKAPIDVNSLLTKKKKPLRGMKASELWFCLKSDMVRFCQNLGLIASRVTCRCGEEMQIRTKKQKKDGSFWGCSRTIHGQQKAPTMSIRRGTWFQFSRITIEDILSIAYMWIYSYSNTSMIHESGKTFLTVKEWCNACSDACQLILESKTKPIGGPSKFVEFFECQFESKKKTTKRMKKSPEGSDWVFCGLEHLSTQLVCVFLQGKKPETILKTIKKYILPETTLFGFNFMSFKQLSYEDYIFLTEEHKITFFDIVTRTELTTHKELLDVANRPLKGYNGWCNYKYDTQFCEYVYRKSLQFSEDAFITFLRDIGKVYKPHDKLEQDSILPD